MTGETQLRARRTRIKILRAIADKNGSACFSEIRNATGLSTGSIYYHLERMGNYVNKDSKHYTITEEGLQMLRELDSKSSSSPTYK
ncbi:MAG TPA: winged helix-turn-helix domain-containing protein, partial [Candidatus Nitrosopolaris rasttigaisensis]|nr:winged helix-turn-helix domain-containing protein [Candidatus Nitrosopolaris rasttigaisensis]